jgi:O-antigen biosynthesis protein
MDNIVSVMCNTYNRLELTKTTFKSLFEKTDHPFRLIVVDNGSEDGTIEWLKDFKHNNPFCQSIDLHFNEKNLGIASGRNRCLKIANQYNDPWLSTIDNDIEFIDGWLTKCIDFLLVNPNFSIGLNMEDVNYPIQKFNGKEIQLKSKGNLGTACTVFPRDLHNKLGYFVSYGLYSCEDSNFYIRSRVVGYKMGYLPENGIHLGVGDNDTGEYREWKHKLHQEAVNKFKADCYLYYNKQKPIYQPFME